MTLVSKDCSEETGLRATRASNKALARQCTLLSENWDLHGLGALEKLGIKSESTPSSCKPFHMGFIISKVIFYEWMQIFLRFLQLSLGEFLAGGLVPGWGRCTLVNETVRSLTYGRSCGVRGDRTCATGTGKYKTISESTDFFSPLCSSSGVCCCCCFLIYGVSLIYCLPMSSSVFEFLTR